MPRNAESHLRKQFAKFLFLREVEASGSRGEAGVRATQLGARFREKLREALAPYEIVEEVRALGLLNGIGFRAPKRLVLRAQYEAF
jgi:hypothetical protein